MARLPMVHVALLALAIAYGASAQTNGATNATGPATTPPEGCICTTLLQPVCGVDGKDYGNPCAAACEKVAVACRGRCPCSGGNGTDPIPPVDPPTDGGGDGGDDTVVIASAFAPWAEPFFGSPAMRFDAAVANFDCSNGSLALSLRKVAPSTLLPNGLPSAAVAGEAPEDVLSIQSSEAVAQTYHYQLSNGRMIICTPSTVVAADPGPGTASSATSGSTTGSPGAVAGSGGSEGIVADNPACEVVLPGTTKYFKYVSGLAEMHVLAQALASPGSFACADAGTPAPQAGTAALYLQYVLGQVVAQYRLQAYGLAVQGSTS